MGKRRSSYEVKVATFIAANGPKFTLAQVTRNSLPRNCDCCGYQPIMNHYHVTNDQGARFVIGSECQELVLGFTDAALPAARIRALDSSQLVLLGTKYGITLDKSLPQDKLAQEVIDARRRTANVLGWVSRRRNAPAAVVEQQEAEKTA